MSSVDGLPPLREVIDIYDLNAKKSLGQHFLLDLNITRKIVRQLPIQDGDLAIEVGPGPGGLTRALLEAGCQLTVIERDKRCIEALTDLNSHFGNKLIAIEADALGADEAALISTYDNERDAWLVSNLPYNISTELLIKWLKASPRWWRGMALMFQKEVADRIIAAHGNKTYGRLSVISQSVCDVTKGFDLPARAFTPPPKVDSTVLVFTPKAELPCDVLTLEKITAAAFSQRRKMLRSSLNAVMGENTIPFLEEAQLEPTLRAEQVSVVQYQQLSRIFASLKAQ
ncbi:MAG: 16S rRNA (adenine(1518)-N(6)/adenine(1519)-N(6))-dimethyltransferase RsmA [Aquisalinus sp.]|nr:16S rRNA (adenine(1518)-N(6)/adenine(1519)-N(6))-dimethyltransferase RsmA [Aquisalinus sp.]